MIGLLRALCIAALLLCQPFSWPCAAESSNSTGNPGDKSDALSAAANLKGTMETPVKSPDDASATKTSKAAHSKGGALGKRIVAFTTGMVVGTPIAMARTLAKETVAGCQDLVGDNRNPLFLAPAGALSIPFAGVSSLLCGPIYSMVNSWKYSDDQPYSKASFSLGEMR